MQQFFLAGVAPKMGERLVLPEEIAHQLRHVLRFRGGESVRLVFLSEGASDDERSSGAFLAHISLDKKAVYAMVENKIHEQREFKTPLVLATARIKRDKWEWVLQKAAELGVHAIMPMRTARVNEKELTPNQEIRARRILKEAAEQAERHLIPRLYESVALEDLESACRARLDCAPEKIQYIVLAERHAQAPGFFHIVQNLDRSLPVVLLVGPEGGFNSEEFAFFEKSGFIFAHLGPRILRAESAAILAAGMAAQWLEGESPEDN